MKLRRLTTPNIRALCAATRHARKALCERIAGAAAGSDQALATAFPALVAAVEAGFRREELVMETLGIARVREQRQDNALILSALHHAMPAVERGDLVLGRQVIAALLDLLDLHRLSADLLLAVADRPQPSRPVKAWYRASRRALAS